MKDYYAILGIRSTAHAAEIKRIYRRLVVQYHPDKNPDPQAHAYMAEINEAYDVLGDPDSRAAYDLRRHQGWTELFGSAAAAEPAPSAPRHRDPRYRPRAAPVSSARREQREMMQMCVPYIRWFNIVGLVVTVLFAIDYILPYKAIESEIVDYRAQHMGSRYGSQGGYSSTKLNLANGEKLSVNGFSTPVILDNPRIRYRRTLVYKTLMSIDYRGIHTKVGYTYRALAIFPLVLFGTSLAAVLRRKNIEFFFNASFVNGLLLLITLWLIL
jgi:curved DNA-binding protein CbpA